jgi:hypothetical protein
MWLLLVWPDRDEREFKEWKRLREAQRLIDGAIDWGESEISKVARTRKGR